jgi:hypothetical protein
MIFARSSGTADARPPPCYSRNGGLRNEIRALFFPFFANKKGKRRYWIMKTKAQLIEDNAKLKLTVKNLTQKCQRLDDQVLREIERQIDYMKSALD